MYCRMKIILKKDYYKIGKLSASLYLLNERQVEKISPLKRGHIESARHTLNHLLCCYEFSPRKKSHNYVLWQLWNGAALNVFMLPSLLILDIPFSFFLFTFFIVQKYSTNPRQEIIISSPRSLLQISDTFGQCVFSGRQKKLYRLHRESKRKDIWIESGQWCINWYTIEL